MSDDQLPPTRDEVLEVFLEGGHGGLVAGESLFLDLAEALEHALVVAREDLEELRQLGVPVVEQEFAAGGAGECDVFFDLGLDHGDVRVAAFDEAVEVDHLLVEALFEQSVDVIDVGDAAGHAGGEVAAGLAEHDDLAAGHVFAAVVADAFDDGLARRSCGRRSARRRCR